LPRATLAIDPTLRRRHATSLGHSLAVLRFDASGRTIHASGIKSVDAICHLALRGCRGVADLQLSGIFWQYWVEVAGGLRDAAGQRGRADHQSDRRAQALDRVWHLCIRLPYRAIATAMAAWYTRRQWESSVDNGHRQLRAYVFPEQANLVWQGTAKSTASQDARAEAGRILTRSINNGALDPGDRTYLAKLIAARTGISQQDAEKRIDDVMAQMKAAAEKAKQAADAARKASASASFYLFFSMLIGAFIASAAGAIGGRQRDLV
jgi:hypothetical protein